MHSDSLATAIINWLGGLIGTFALLVGLSFLPGLFGRHQSDQVIMMISDLPLSKDVLSFFNGEWGIGLIVVATVLFVLVCLFFSMSTHAMVVAVAELTQQTIADAEYAAWGVVMALNLSLVLLFVTILYGSLLSFGAILISLLILLAMASLLFANYAEIKMF